MTIGTTLPGHRRAVRVGALTAGFWAAVALRIAVGGPDAVQSPRAGLVFAACLASLSLAAGTRLTSTGRDLRLGLVGAAVICAPAALSHLVHAAGSPTVRGFGGWAAVVCVVAVVEEAFLRGALYDALHATGDGVAGDGVAIAGAAVAFALLHVPLYGWRALPLDLAVGVVLGLLRRRAGSATAPAIAHAAADLAGWFLR